jgi:thioester reductase-like protein
MNQTVFLTGATGALGPILAAELLTSGVAGRLNVLIRPNGASATVRFDRWIETLESVLASSGTLLPNPRKRVSVVGGDLCVDGLDLNELQRDTLTNEIDTIIHGAADTGFRGSGQSHRETNVEGTRRVLELASQCKNLRKIVFVSTICTAGIQTGTVREEAVTKEPNFANAYERTKWEAEHLVLNSGLPVEIVRVGIVMGSCVTGAVYRLGALHHVFRWFGGGQMPVVPGTPTTPVDLIDAEMAAKIIRMCASTPLTNAAIYHAAAGKRAVLLKDLVQFCTDEMLGAMRMHDPSMLDQHTRHAPAHTRLARAWLPVLLAPRVYDTTRAEQLWGGELPLNDWRDTLAKVTEYCGFGARQRASVG